jgi:hypothetical protein
MHIPYVIDNIEYRLGDVLNYLLQREQGQQVNVATAYFSVRRFRLLLGNKPLEGEDIGLRPDAAAYLRHELNAEPFTASTLRLVEDLIRFLRRDDVDVRLYLGHAPNEHSRRYFLHAKCYLFYGGRGDDKSLFDHLNPIVGILGSSNFTGPGLLSNRELNRFDRKELRELRQFLKQPLVGASIQQLRKTLQTYGSPNDIHGLIETVRALYQHQVREFSSNGSGDKKSVSRIKREDLKLVCYEYIYA